MSFSSEWRNGYVFGGVEGLREGFFGFVDLFFVVLDLLFELFDLVFEGDEVLFFSLSCKFSLCRIEYFFMGTGLAVGVLVFESFGIGDGGTLSW